MKEPKPWTSSKPPRGHSYRLLDAPTVISMAIVMSSVPVGVLFPKTQGWCFIAFVIAVVFLLSYSALDIYRWFEQRRWLRSPGPEETRDN